MEPLPPPVRHHHQHHAKRSAPSWTVDEVTKTVAYCCDDINIENVASIFRAHDIDGDALVDLTARDVVALVEGLDKLDPRIPKRTADAMRKYGPRTRLVRRLQKFVRKYGTQPFADVEAAVYGLAEMQCKHDEDAPIVVILSSSKPGKEQHKTATPRSTAPSDRRVDTRGGICSWSAAEVGFVVRHLLVFRGKADREAAGAVARLFVEQGLDGEVLKLLNAEAWTALTKNEKMKLGLRLWLAREISAFLEHFGDLAWPQLVEKELQIDQSPLIMPPPSERVPPEAPTMSPEAEDMIVSLMGKHRDNRLLDPSLRLESDLEQQGKPDAIKQVVVPVFMTIMVKKLAGDLSNDDKVNMVCTVIQRPLCYDLTKLKRLDASQKSLPHFEMRVNDGENDAKDCFRLRKVAPKTIKAASAEFHSSSTTFESSLPLKLYSVMSSHPFHVTAAEVLLELTSFTAHQYFEEVVTEEPGKQQPRYELRPNLLCHCKDIRNLVAVRDWDKKTKLDEMKKWKFINTSPSVEFVIDGDGPKAGKPFYTPKVRITFYLYRELTQPFLETVMPIIFAIFTNMLNILFGNEFNEFLANSIAIGLTVVFMIPRLSQNESFDEQLQWNHFYVLWIFLGLMASATVYTICHDRRLNKDPETKATIKTAAIVFMWLSLLIPLRNLALYLRLKWKLQASPAFTQCNPMTFNGKSGDGVKKAVNSKGSDVELENLVQFFDPRQTFPPQTKLKPGEKPPKAVPNMNSDCIHPESRKYLDSYKSSKPWSFDAKIKTCRVGYTRLEAMLFVEKSLGLLFGGPHFFDSDLAAKGGDEGYRPIPNNQTTAPTNKSPGRSVYPRGGDERKQQPASP